jgi:hypothetical protein
MIATTTTTMAEPPYPSASHTHSPHLSSSSSSSSSDPYPSSLSSGGRTQTGQITLTSFRLVEAPASEEEVDSNSNTEITQSPIDSSTNLSNCQSPDSNATTTTLTSSPKIGKWSEGSSYPSGFGIRIDSRSHLEVFDQKHRYGKNLRLYYKEWVTQKIELQFFDWLASPNLTEVFFIIIILFFSNFISPPLGLTCRSLIVPGQLWTRTQSSIANLIRREKLSLFASEPMGNFIIALQLNLMILPPAQLLPPFPP